MIFYRLVSIEIYKIFRRWRTYIGFVTIIGLVPLIMWLVRRYGFDVQDNALSQISDSFIFVGSLVNGLLVAYYLIHVMWVHFPFFIILVAGDLVSNESASGTLRLYLTRPVSRAAIISAKYVATFIYTLTIVLFLGVFSILCGLLIVGGGDVFVFDKGILILTQSDALMRFLWAYLLAVWAQMTIASIAFLFSTISSNSVAPIISTYAVIGVAMILSVLRIDALEVIKPFLFTTYLDVFFAPFSEPIPWAEIGRQCLRLGYYCAGCFALSMIIFTSRDISS